MVKTIVSKKQKEFEQELQSLLQQGYIVEQSNLAWSISVMFFYALLTKER
jgi:hypothetical protein